MESGEVGSEEVKVEVPERAATRLALLAALEIPMAAQYSPGQSTE